MRPHESKSIFVIGGGLLAVGLIILWIMIDQPGVLLRSTDDTNESPSKLPTNLGTRSGAVIDDKDRIKESSNTDQGSGEGSQTNNRAVRGPVFERVIQFPDGTEIVVTYKNAQLTRSLPPGIDNGTDPGFVERLEPLVREGNGAAAYHLYSSLEACRNAPKSLVEFESARAAFYSGYRTDITTADRSPALLDPNVNIPAVIDELERKFHRCSGIAKQSLDSLNSYLAIAADEGIHPATFNYAKLLSESDENLAFQYMEKAWRAGAISAALGLAEILNANHGNTSSDRVSSYAYYYAWARLSESLYEGLDGPVHEILRSRIRENAARKMAGFSPFEIEKGTELAKLILEENQNCCVY